MSKIKINRLTNANIYMDGNNLLGRAEEIQLPQIKHKMAEHKALGMVGSAEFFAGIDKLECKIKMTEKNVDNVNEYMMSSDIFVLPSKQEGFPISILEAMSCGLSVIGSDIPEISEAQIINEVDGMIFREGESKALSQVLEKLLNDKSNMKRM